MNPLGAYFLNQPTNFGKFTFEKRVFLRKRGGCTQAIVRKHCHAGRSFSIFAKHFEKKQATWLKIFILLL